MSDLNKDYEAFVAKLFHRNGDLSKDLAHAVLGIITETHELLHATDETNVIEEGGDLTFFGEAADLVVVEALGDALYDEATGRLMVVTRRALMTEASSKPAKEVIASFHTRLADIAKRWVGYGKKPTTEQLVEAAYLSAISITLALGSSRAADLSDDFLKKSNMAKLLKRYPGGEFDAYRAINRDTEAERAAIQSA